MACFAVTNTVAQPASGPLRVSPDNQRYFADAAGKIVYLTGSHTWSSLKDMGSTDPPPEFDFAGYLDMLKRYNHNFIRLWTWELSRYAYDAKTTYAAPFPWPRTGPGTALDGKPTFDLSRLDQPYFDRLRARVIAAGERTDWTDQLTGLARLDPNHEAVHRGRRREGPGGSIRR